MAKIGRPTKYNPDMCQVVIDLMTEGKSIEQVAAHLGIVKQTLYNWAEHNKEFMDAIKQGTELSYAWWLNKGQDWLVETRGGKEANDTFNHVLWYMNMKNRFGWKDKSETDHNVTIKQKIKLPGGQEIEF